MKTMDHLTRAYEGALVAEFDDDSRYVFLSDAHRGDGSKADEFVDNRSIFLAALDHYLSEGFTLVEGGDCDDLWEFKFGHILKANGAAYERVRRFHDAGRYIRLFGNHDIQASDPEYVRTHLARTRNRETGLTEDLLVGLKVHESLLLRHRATGQELLAIHGHQGDFANDQNWRMTMWTFRLFWRFLHAFGIHSPSSPIRNSFKRHKVEKNYVKWIREHRLALIVGHTHREKFPQGADQPYFNTGSCAFPGYITGIEIVGGAIALIRWRIEPDADHYLRVTRRVMAGPEPIGRFDRRR